METPEGDTMEGQEGNKRDRAKAIARELEVERMSKAEKEEDRKK